MLALDWSEWSATCAVHCTLWEKTPVPTAYELGGPVWRDKCPANGENQTTIPWVSSPLPSCSNDSALAALCITVLCSEFVKMCQEDMMGCFKAIFTVLQVMCMSSRKPREKSATVVVFWQRFKPGTSLTNSRESNNYSLILSNSIITDMVISTVLFAVVSDVYSSISNRLWKSNLILFRNAYDVFLTCHYWIPL